MNVALIQRMVGESWVKPFGVEYDFERPAAFVKVTGSNDSSSFKRESTVEVEYVYRTRDEFENMKMIVERKIVKGPFEDVVYIYHVSSSMEDTEMLPNGFSSTHISYSLKYEEAA